MQWKSNIYRINRFILNYKIRFVYDFMLISCSDYISFNAFVSPLIQIDNDSYCITFCFRTFLQIIFELFLKIAQENKHVLKNIKVSRGSIIFFDLDNFTLFLCIISYWNQGGVQKTWLHEMLIKHSVHCLLIR